MLASQTTLRHNTGAADPQEQSEICQYLDWDSEFFGRRIARASVNRVTEQTVHAIESWCNSRRIDCLYFLADSSDANTVKLAENAGFRLVDVRVCLELLGGLPPEATGSSCVRASRAEDYEALRAIAGVSHRESRFYRDGNFVQSRCDALYQTWIEKSLRGYADAVLVAELNNEPMGYVSCHLPPAGNGSIGLFAIANKAQGRGLGRQLLSGALCWFQKRNASEVTVVTQGHNVRAQRLYQAGGFVTRSVQLWYHRWFRRPG
jgi:dTDP-4-amino-4,6-dideoxy-D-galactose acyltransferase